jgi:hypothetical protein
MISVFEQELESIIEKQKKDHASLLCQINEKEAIIKNNLETIATLK